MPERLYLLVRAFFEALAGEPVFVFRRSWIVSCRAHIATNRVMRSARVSQRHADADAVLRIVNTIADDREITKVDDVVRLAGLGKRTLERLFREYVGVGPKWVIQHYRLQEAAEYAATPKPRDWADLAVRLGYADQAHFIRDFKRFVGQSPTRYAATARAPGDP